MRKLTVLLIVVLLLTGCLAMNTQEDDITASSPTQVAEQLNGEKETESNTNAHGSPPKQLIFRDSGFDEIVELSKLLLKSDSEVEEYLLSHDASRLYMNGLENKKDIENLLSMLSKIYLPVMEGVPPTYIMIFPDQNQVWVGYYDIAGGGPYTFSVSPETDFAQEEIQALREEGMTLNDMNPTASMQRNDSLSGVTHEYPIGIEIYNLVDKPKGASDTHADPNQVFVMDVNDEYIFARVFNVNDLSTCVNGLLAFDYAKLSFTENGAQVVEIVGKDMSQSSDVSASEENEAKSGHTND